MRAEESKHCELIRRSREKREKENGVDREREATERQEFLACDLELEGGVGDGRGQYLGCSN